MTSTTPTLRSAIQAEKLEVMLTVQLAETTYLGLLRQWGRDLRTNPQFWLGLGFHGWLREQLRMVAHPNGERRDDE